MLSLRNWSIQSQSNIKVVDIKCGWSHSLLVTGDGAHFLFGHNDYNQVTLVQSQKGEIRKPTAIDSLFSQRGLEVDRVDLGCSNTWIRTQRSRQVRFM